MSVVRRGAGSGGRAAGRRNPRHGRFKPRPAVLAAGVSVEERPLGTMEQTVNTARGTPTFSAVRGDYNLMRFTLCAWGHGQAESPAFRAPFILEGLEAAVLEYGRARAG